MLDLDRLHELSTELGVDVLESLAGEFFDDFKERSIVVAALIQADSSPTHIREFAHDIKGSAANLAFVAMADAAHQIGTFVKDNQLDRSRIVLSGLADIAAKSQSAFNDWLEVRVRGI
jgi:HPt (histidine-containing phosphotransfer) domain-containing protein